MSTRLYPPSQLSTYFTHIGLPPPLRSTLLSTSPPRATLQTLSTLLTHHLRTVPFENLSLHYAAKKGLVLSEAGLFEKVLGGKRRGGYCMEVNTFFGAVLRGCGFECYLVGGKIGEAMHGGTEGFRGLSHVVNIVTIDGMKYLVDVGFGVQNLLIPVPLVPDQVVRHESGFEMKMQHGPIAGSIAKQDFWIYNFREKVPIAGSEGDGWVQGYAFSEGEVFPEDVGVLNYCVETNPEGFFTNNVMCVKVLEDGRRLSLFNERVSIRSGGELEVLETFNGEEERVEALERLFGVVVTAEDREGIVGMVTELKEGAGEAVKD